MIKDAERKVPVSVPDPGQWVLNKGNGCSCD